MAIHEDLHPLVGQRVGRFEFRILYLLIEVGSQRGYIARSWRQDLILALADVFMARAQSNQEELHTEIETQLVLVDGSEGPMFPVGGDEIEYSFLDDGEIEEVKRWALARLSPNIINLLKEVGLFEQDPEPSPAKPSSTSITDMVHEIDPPPSTEDSLADGDDLVPDSKRGGITTPPRSTRHPAGN